MQATEFEFRHRLWIIAAIFVFAFCLYRVDHRVAAVVILRFVSPEHAQVDLSSMHWHANWRLNAILSIGAMLATLAALLRTWATAYLHSGVVHDPAMHVNKLVADGPYRNVRNPLYLGTQLVSIGIGLLASPLGWAVLVPLVWLFDERLIRREEAAMRREQGESFAAYCAKVPRMLFSPWPRLPPGGGVPRWRQALLGESFSWAFALQMCIVAATLNITWANCLAAIGFAMAIVMRQVSHRMTPEPATRGEIVATDP